MLKGSLKKLETKKTYLSKTYFIIDIISFEIPSV